MSTTTTENSQNAKPGFREMPPNGHGDCIIGQEEIDLVTQALRKKQPFRYYASFNDTPPNMVATLEAELKEKMGVDYALAVTSGTAALEVALAALGVGPGDEVIVPAWSWISCFTVIARAGALPVLAEVDESLNMDPAEIDRLATDKTKAILFIHFQGVAGYIDQVVEKANARGIKVLEDCASSVGASYQGKRIGTYGHIAIYSFQTNKMITCGEGGAVVTNDPTLYERAVRMHDLGQYRDFHKQFHEPTEDGFCGVNYRMSEISGAVALAQLRKMDGMIEHVRSLNRRLLKELKSLSGFGYRDIPDPDGDLGIEFYLFFENYEIAEKFREAFAECGVSCRARTGTYMQYAREYVMKGKSHAEALSPFRQFDQWPAPGYREEDFPKSNALINGMFTVPIGALFTEEDVDHIAQTFRWAHSQILS